MARTSRDFMTSKEVEDIARKLCEVMYPWIGYIEPDEVYWAEITSDKPKNSKPICIEKGKDWVKKLAGKEYMVAVYSECWVEWDDQRRQHELLHAMAQISGIKPLPPSYNFHMDGLRFVMGSDLVESDWRRANNKGAVLPDLLDEKVRACFPHPEEYEDEEEEDKGEDDE
jgi:hypothetical protein